MERIKLKTGVEATETTENKEAAKQQWEDSIFVTDRFSEETEYLIDLSEEKNAHPKEELSIKELSEIKKFFSAARRDFPALEASVKQSQSKELRAKAIKAALDLYRSLRFISGQKGLRMRLRTMAVDNVDVFAEETISGKVGAEHAKDILLILIMKELLLPEQNQHVLGVVFPKIIEQAISTKKIDQIDLAIMLLLALTQLNLKEQEENVAKYNKILENYLRETPYNWEIITGCLQIEEFEPTAQGQMAEILYKYIPKEHLVEIAQRWKAGGGTAKFMPRAFAENFRALEEIEKERPGIAAFLISKFNIYNFGRYPKEMLIKQYDEYENTDLPYGLVIFAEDDHNGFLFEDKEELSKMSAELEGKYITRIAEVGGKEKLLRLLIRLRLKYGLNQKISFAVIGAHGNTNLLVLGRVENKEDRELKVDDLIKYQGRKYELFDKDASIILISCDSGRKGGIGTEMSKVLGRTVIAPSGHSGLKSIKPVFEKEGGLSFDVKYTHKTRAAKISPT